jgi:hypothetical protein
VSPLKIDDDSNKQPNRDPEPSQNEQEETIVNKTKALSVETPPVAVSREPENIPANAATTEASREETSREEDRRKRREERERRRKEEEEKVGYYFLL